MTLISTLSSIQLPPTLGLSRELPGRASLGVSTREEWERYDRQTLIYDIVHIENLGIVRVYLPRLLNLASLLNLAAFSIDGQRCFPKRHRVFRRFETLDFLSGIELPERFGLTLQGNPEIVAGVNRSFHEEYRGRRVIYTLLRNEKLEWIADWLTFHNEVHGADAVLISDNGSNRFSSLELLDAVRSIKGYQTCRILSVPLPWGPRGRAQGVDDGKFLQTALLNLTRDRFFADAAGVLNLDVDELLLRRGDVSVFDRVNRWGLVTFPGEWRYSGRDVISVRHSDHRFRDPFDKPCATKYCYKPASKLGRMCLSVHGLEKLSRKFFSGKRQYAFLHCRNISTSWKYDRTHFANPHMVLDSEAARILDAVFVTPAQTAP
jgi:hypothetical protein